jgi:hypothetical protein
LFRFHRILFQSRPLPYGGPFGHSHLGSFGISWQSTPSTVSGCQCAPNLSLLISDPLLNSLPLLPVVPNISLVGASTDSCGVLSPPFAERFHKAPRQPGQDTIDFPSASTIADELSPLPFYLTSGSPIGSKTLMCGFHIFTSTLGQASDGLRSRQ